MITIISTLLFYTLIFFICKYLFKNIGNNNISALNDNDYDINVNAFTSGIIYTVITIIFFLPILKVFNTAVIGPAEDNFQHLWDIWWARKVFTGTGLSLSYTDYLYFPGGVSLLYHAYSFFNVYFSVILMPFLSPTAAYNLLMLITYPLSGIGAFCLIKYLTGKNYMALIGGFIFAFSPAHYMRVLHHIELASMQFIPFFILYFIKSIKGSNKKDLILATLFFFLSAACSWYYLVFNLYFILFSYIYIAIKEKAYWLKDTLIKSLIIVIVPLFFFLPWIIKMILYSLNHQIPEAGGYNHSVIDTMSLFIPYTEHFLGGIHELRVINAKFTGSFFETTGYMGIVNITIILVCFKATIKQNSKFFLAALVFLLISMGETLHIFGYISPILLPYSLIKHIPFIGNARCPSRAIVYVYLFMSIIVVIGLRHLIEYTLSRSRKIWPVILIILLLVFDFAHYCNSSSKVYLPNSYDIIKNDTSTFAVLDVPWSYYINQHFMMYQTLHGKPIVQGAISRKIDKTLSDSLLVEDLYNQKELLKDNNVKYIVVHWKKFVSDIPGIFRIKLFKPTDIMRKKVIMDLINTYKMIFRDGDRIVFQVYD